MNKNLLNYYYYIYIYESIIKYPIKNIFQISKIENIFINIGFKNIEKKQIINILLLLKLIFNTKAQLTYSKKNSVILKIKKNSIVGCKLILREKNIFIFLEKLILFILPNFKILKINNNNKNVLSFQIKNISNFFELKNENIKFNDILPIDVTIKTNTKNNKEFFLLLNSFFIVK